MDRGNFTVDAGVITQTGSFSVNPTGYLGIATFTFTEAVTVGGITELLTFSGQDEVTMQTDTLTIFALGPVVFGTATLDFQQTVVVADNVITYPVGLGADVTGVIPSPEPSTLAMSGTGILALAGMARRKFQRA